MQNSLLNIPSLNYGLLDTSISPLQSFQELVTVASALQEIVLKQQLIISTLLSKQQQNQQKKVLSSLLGQNESLPVKIEFNSRAKLDQVNNVLTDNTSDSSEITGYGKENESSRAKQQIIRRNGFKPLKDGSQAGRENCDSESENHAEPEKICKGRKNPSKAKHLWVNYGRRIIEYGISQTKGDMQEKVKQLVGKLNSKKDFENVFQINPNDSGEDRLFKTLIGRLAIFFVKHKSAASFEGSKYKDEMITQRHVVAAWIERLICE